MFQSTLRSVDAQSRLESAQDDLQAVFEIVARVALDQRRGVLEEVRRMVRLLEHPPDQSLAFAFRTGDLPEHRAEGEQQQRVEGVHRFDRRTAAVEQHADDLVVEASGRVTIGGPSQGSALAV